MKILQPSNWPRPKGYSNGVSVRGQLIFVSGMIGWDESGKLVADNFVAQARKALQNAVAVLAEANARPEHIVRMNWYVTDRVEYLGAQKELGRVYRDVIGPHFPAMTAVEVSALMEPGARVEIEITAVIPE